MPILRSCNELLRRLSRAEDTAFCGRVFIFLFQSFPLGDKSSVNLRGEYHLENVTTFDAVKAKTEGEQMDIDSEQPPPEESPVNPSKGVRSSRGAKGEKAMSPDELYPIFWTLQQGFNQPKLLFDANRFADFKTGLQATMVMFRQQSVTSARTPSKAPDDAKQGFKRKRGQADDDLANTFNPKYLTSRDLFELEVSADLIVALCELTRAPDQRSLFPKTHHCAGSDCARLSPVAESKSQGKVRQTATGYQKRQGDLRGFGVE